MTTAWFERAISSGISRRRFLQIGAAAATGLLAACGGSSSTTPTPASSSSSSATSTAASSSTAPRAATPLAGIGQSVASPVASPSASPAAVSTGSGSASTVKQGGTLVSMVVAEPTSMDIAAGNGQHNYAIMSNVFENLLQWADDSVEVIPGLAQSYEVSSDGLAYTFKLRQGVKFHDGTDMDANAVQFSYSRVLDPNNQYFKAEGPFPDMDAWYGAIDPTKTVVVDPYTVTLKLKQPFSPLVGYLAWPAAAIVSPTAVKQYPDSFHDHPTGTGPFKYQSWQHNVQVNFVRNDNYWQGMVALDKLIFRPIVEEQTRITELLAGHIDFAYDLPPDNVAQIQSNSAFHFLQTELGHVWFLVLNTKDGPTKDVRVRQAIAYGIDKNAIIKDVLKGWGVPATGPVPSVIAYAYDKNVQTYNYDPNKAKQLLQQAGFPNGFQTTFWVTQSGSGMQSPVAMGQAIQAMLAQVGINLKIQQLEWGAYLAAYGKGLPADVGVAEMSWFTTDAQNIAKLTLTTDTIPPKGYNAGYYNNPKIDDLLKQFYDTVDQQKQAQAMDQVQQIVAQDVPNVYIDTQVDTGALSTKFTGFNLHPSQLLRFWKTHQA